MAGVRPYNYVNLGPKCYLLYFDVNTYIMFRIYIYDNMISCTLNTHYATGYLYMLSEIMHNALNYRIPCLRPV